MGHAMSKAPEAPQQNGGGSWESNPPGLASRRTSTGFEDRGRHQVGTTRHPSPNALQPARPQGHRICATIASERRRP